MKSTPLLLLALIGIAFTCTHAFADVALFAAQELQLKDAIPNETEWDRPFEDPLPALLTTSKDKQLVQLGNCRDYLAVRNQITGSDNDADYRVLVFQTVPCIALSLLKTASIAKQSALPKNFHSYTNTAFYPATLWPAVSDEEQKSRAWSTGTLLTYSKKTALRKINTETLGLEMSGYGFHITLLARGDFNHDGWEDAAFRWKGYALQGSYIDSRLVVLTRTTENSGFLELPLKQLLAK
ncbi:MAG: hypothetical protein HOP34_08310 [Methylococcaceae bacterium]|nr:hypothetical protein [Methylococcaceae bacterium]